MSCSSPIVEGGDGCRRGDTVPTICIIGAGFSGICAAVQLKRQLGIHSFTIFEGNDDLGGTWYVSNYPGAQCDVSTHLYSLSFEPNPNWSATHVDNEEILQYLKKIAEKYDLYPLMKFKTLVTGLEWDETIAKWRVTVFHKQDESTQNLIFDIVINGPGALRVPKYPKEFQSFEGPTIHSAEWDPQVELKDKVVALVGNGATGVQLGPALAEKAKSLHVYQRSAPYAAPRARKQFSATTRFLFSYIPLLMWLYRCSIFLYYEIIYFALRSDSYSSRMATSYVMEHLRKQVKDEELRKQLTPKYRFGCKRFAVTDDYFKIFTQPCVKLNTSPIVNVKGNSILTEDGAEQKVDVLVLATGYDVQEFFSPLEISGRDGVNILKNWKENSPSAYFGIISHAMPNHFILLGPNTLLGNNSVLFMMECQVEFVMKIIRKMMESGSKFVSVKSEAEQAYMKQLREDLKPMVWSTSCDTWYKNSRGDVTGPHPWSASMYWWKTRKVNFNHFDFRNK